jgi:hypothetical protein
MSRNPVLMVPHNAKLFGCNCNTGRHELVRLYTIKNSIADWKCSCGAKGNTQHSWFDHIWGLR